MRLLKRTVDIALKSGFAKNAEVLGVLVMLAVAVSLSRQPKFIWSEPEPQLVFGALLSLALLLHRLTALASLFYLSGAVSLIWSLTPANTLLNTLWELTYLAAFVVGQSTTAFALVNVAVLVAGLETTLLLDLFGLNQYFSGSAHYLAGAQALLFIPLCLSTATRSDSRLNRIVSTLAAAACLLLILNSGARSVYLPALLVVPLTVLRLALPTGQRFKSLAVASVTLALVLGLAAILPGPTVHVPLQTKAVKANTEMLGQPQVAGQQVAVPAAVIEEEGGIRSRLKMWEQTFSIGLGNPLGTGAGSFRDTIHAFQQYPLIGFSSAHNFLLEVFSTGGWPRLVFLVLLIVVTLLRGWRSSRWPIAIGAAGLWATMLFDITYQMPLIMLLAFWSLGASQGAGSSPASKARRQLPIVLAVVTLLIAVSGALWWYTPCSGSAGECAAERHFGYRAEVQALAPLLEAEESRLLADQAANLNPNSLWAWTLRVDQITEPIERLEASRELALKFPLAAPENYLRWAEAALEAGADHEAREAIVRGREVFPPGFAPAGVPLGDRAGRYQRWLDAADRMMEATEPPQ